MKSAARLGVALALVLNLAGVRPVRADETCMSSDMPKITGQEDFVYVWTSAWTVSATDRTSW